MADLVLQAALPALQLEERVDLGTEAAVGGPDDEEEDG